ncbi:MAG TPA: DUF2461 domain-containing protein, partial [Clostridia bacterium]|nr:DUF2461 domain-containing protein [Clostridia bacterium]
MNKYDFIKSDVFMLLAENRFRNSKDFYEEHKNEIKQKVILPMRQIAGIISQDLIKLDEKMNLNPVKMVSRIRRDTRFSKDKTLYRENVWVMFMRPKNEHNTFPCMWFEIQPGCYSYGIGIYNSKPRFMEYYRDEILKNPDEFLSAVNKAKKVGTKFIDNQ